MSDKQILVVPAADVNLSFVNGFLKTDDCQGVLEHLIEKSTFMMRDEAETDPNFKQLIPYCVVKSGDKIFMYERNKKGGEARLHNLRSVGLGGHLKFEDGATNKQCYYRGLNRELKEELGVEKHQVLDKVAGFIYDDSNEVGKVHLGIVHILQLWNPKQEFHIEDTMSNWAFESPEVLSKSIADFETWSQIIIREGLVK